MTANEVTALRDVLSAHQAAVRGASQVSDKVDLERVAEVHTGISWLLTQWDEFSANEQREIIRTIQNVVDRPVGRSNLSSVEGALDEVAELRRLEALLGYL